MTEEAMKDILVVEKVGGWKRLEKQVVYENPWIEVSHEKVERPNGTEGIYGVVHFKSRALGVVALDEQDQVVLVKQSRYACDEVTYELPEGGGPFEEAPLAAIQRELEEETGLLAKQWTEILTMRTSNSVTDEIAYIYLATDLYDGVQNLEDTEDIEVLRVPFETALDMIDQGKITDSLTVAGLLKVSRMRAQHA